MKENPMASKPITQKVTAQDLRPDQETLLRATLTALKGRVDEHEVRRFVKEAARAAAPAPIGATANVKIAVWGKVLCEPDGQPWIYDNTIWGGPAYFGDSVGFMYTAYDNWDAFYANVTSCHVQGFDVGGGILQINWFIANGTPVGQYNGAAAGAGLVEGGGAGKWTRK
jgi:hypothetical protein